MKTVVDALAHFGEHWLINRGWRRTVVIIVTVLAYAAFFLVAYLSGGVNPFLLAVNFFLVGLAGSTLGIPGGLAAGAISGLLLGPFLVLFVSHVGSVPEVFWVIRFLIFLVFGFFAGAVSSVFRRQIKALHNARDLFVQAQKMEAIGRLTGGIAHDFNNMLTAIGGYAELLVQRTEATGETKKLFDDLLEVVKRSASLTHQLLAVGRKGNLEPRAVKLEDGIRSLAKMLHRILGENIDLRLELAEDSWNVDVDPVQIDQVLMNLAVNAADAMPKGGRLTIRTEKLVVDRVFIAQHPELELGDYVMITVVDTGGGIPHSVAPHVFEPFFTTKDSGKGTGLGLSTAYGIVKQLHGDIWFSSEPRHGTSFRICLPRAHDQQPAGMARERNREANRRPSGATVLVAEDDDNVRTVITKLLKEAGYSVRTAMDGAQALKLIEDPKIEIDIFITDVMMPKVSGIKVIEAAYRLRPNIGAIVMSGYTRDEQDNIAIIALADQFIEKPFSGEHLLTTVRQLL